MYFIKFKYWELDTNIKILKYIKISKKTATLILQLIMQKMREHNTKKAQNNMLIHAKMRAKHTH